MPEKKCRLLLVAISPVPYSIPIFRHLAQDPRMEIQVAYCTMEGAQGGYDPEFGCEVQWDVPLLDGYPWVHVPNRSPRPKVGPFWGLLNTGMWKLIRRGRFDAVIFYTGYRYATFWIGWLAARMSGTAFLFAADSSSLEPRDGRRWKRAVKALLWPRLFLLFDQVLSPSPAGRAFVRSLGIPDDRTAITPNVADNDWWISQAARADRGQVRRAWGISENDLAVLFCARLQPWKRPLDVLRGFHLANVPDSVLIFAGEGPLRKQLEAEATALGIGDRVRVLGFVNQSQLPATYASADLFVLPSDHDPCPVVVCEAMLCGLPVVLSDHVPGRFDLVRPGVTGEIFPSGDAMALAAVLRKLLADRQQLAVMSRNARELISGYSPQACADSIVDAVFRAIERRKGPAAQSAGAERSRARV